MMLGSGGLSGHLIYGMVRCHKPPHLQPRHRLRSKGLAPARAPREAGRTSVHHGGGGGSLARDDGNACFAKSVPHPRPASLSMPGKADPLPGQWVLCWRINYAAACRFDTAHGYGIVTTPTLRAVTASIRAAIEPLS